MNTNEALAIGIAVGAGLMYYLDPDRGTRRRALLRDQLVHAGHELEDAAVREGRHLRNRAVGAAAEARSRIAEPAVDDRVLEERVRAEMGRATATPGAITVRARGGVVTLAGKIHAREVQELVRAVRDVHGVERVENELEVHETPGNVPDLQGARQHG